MSIIAKTINWTYQDTTRPIHFVWNDDYNINTIHFWCMILYTFKDLIPNYQEYATYAIMPHIDYEEGTEKTLVLPQLYSNFKVETLGHGTIDIQFKTKHHCESSTMIYDIRAEIQKATGFHPDLQQICNSEGEDIVEVLKNGTLENNSTLYVVFNSYEGMALEAGHTLLDYRSKLKIGKLIRMRVLDIIGDYRIVKFSETYDEIEKRTPKFITIDGERTKIKNNWVGEFTQDGLGGRLVMSDDRIDLSKTYALDYW